MIDLIYVFQKVIKMSVRMITLIFRNRNII